MKTIIAGTDFTPSSINACKYAALLAQKLNCKLTIFNLFDAPIIHSNVGLYGISYSAQRSASRHNTHKLSSELQKLFPKVKIESFTTSGEFKNELENFTAQHQIEAAVMGLEAKDKISKFIYGSHSIDIAGKINCPVIIVPSKYKTHKLSNILLTVDSSEKLHKPTLSGFEKFVEKSKIKLALLHVRTADEISDPVITTAKINGSKLPIKILEAKDMQSGIKKYINKRAVDMVAIISKKHSVFYNFFSESNTKKMAFVAKVPVMAIHE
ncbi:MAG: universal stress protein [Bacteroidetes bacterium]|nr:universal stress protein [Bacteroidota bacterium]